ncbi:MAG: AAA family ATPase, partial [Actinobacteria bacterium]|nr:AAA family ATPase [Actinomycetota bacterium]
MRSAAPAEERKLATVLFADLVGSTELADSRDPERTRAMLDRFYDAMAAEIAGAGGTVEKFVGDAVMAVFGAPNAQEDHAERALHAALAMRRRLTELFEGRLRLRIGVNSGEVVVGAAREGSSFVTGDTVNVCARLEQNVTAGEILVGERTVALVRDAFEFDEPIRIGAKGKRDGVACRQLIRALTLTRPRGVGGLQRRLVGRDTEIELLEATYRRVAHEGQPHLVTIMGDAGVGKTRLVRELWDRLGTGGDQPLRRTGRCLSYGQAITYWALGEILKEQLGILESDPPESVWNKLRPREILGLALGLEAQGELHPLAAREKLHEAWLELLQDLVAERPVVVLIEDLHWAEDPLLDLLERTGREVHGRLLIVGTARPELLDGRPTWGGGKRNTSLLWLQPLSQDEAGRLFDDALAEALSPEIRNLVVERAEGNPLFVEELIGTLIDRGDLELVGDSWQAKRLQSNLDIPDSVQAVLAARIDMLPPLEKAALQAASVVGRTFWVGPVRELVGREPDFRLLEERDFIHRSQGSSMAGEEEYSIKHALTREVAYTSLPKARRAQLHAGFATWLEGAGGGRDETAPLLAHHYAEAVRPEDADLAWGGEEAERERLQAKALGWLRRAAELALGRYELGDVISLLQRALDLEDGEQLRAELWRDIGHAHAMRYEGQAFWEAMQNSLQVCKDRVTCGETYSLLALHTAARSGMWQRPPDYELVTGWIERALELSDPETPSRVRALIARAFWTPKVAVEAAREAERLAERLGDRELRSWALDALLAQAYSQHHYTETYELARERLTLIEEISDPDHIVEAHEAAVPAFAAVAQIEEARRLAKNAGELSRKVSPHHELHGLSLQLEVEELAGDWEKVAELTERIERAVSANLHSPCARNARSLLVCAVAAAVLGDEQRAAARERAAEELGMEGYEFALESPRLRLALLRGNPQPVGEAREAAGGHNLSFGLARLAARMDALAALRDGRVEEDAPPLLQKGTYIEPFALRALGIVREDETRVAEARDRLRRMGLNWHAEQTDA